jgi:hypothetical protein
MFDKNKVSHLDVDEAKVSAFVSDENDFAAFEEKQRLINVGRDELSIALATNTYERLSYKYLLWPGLLRCHSMIFSRSLSTGGIASFFNAM